MSHFFTPANRLLSRRRFAGKFALVGLLCLMPLALVFFYFQSEINKSIAFAQLERTGVAYERPVERLLEDVLRHQRMANSLALSHVGTADDLTRQEAKVDQDIQAVDAVDGQLGTSLQSTDAWSKLKTQWQAVKSSRTTDGSAAAHGALVDAMTALIQTVGNNSNLILDPDVDSYYTMDSALTQTPQVLVGISRAHDLAQGAVQHQAITADERTQLTVFTGLISTPLGTLQSDMQQAEQFNPVVKSRVDTAQTAATQQSNAFLDCMQSSLLKAPQPRLTSQACKRLPTKPPMLLPNITARHWTRWTNCSKRACKAFWYGAAR